MKSTAHCVTGTWHVAEMSRALSDQNRPVATATPTPISRRAPRRLTPPPQPRPQPVAQFEPSQRHGHADDADGECGNGDVQVASPEGEADGQVVDAERRTQHEQASHARLPALCALGLLAVTALPQHA